jgi:hypothetical protein
MLPHPPARRGSIPPWGPFFHIVSIHAFAPFIQNFESQLANPIRRANKVVFLKPVLLHFRDEAKNKLAMQQLHHSNLEMYSYCRSYWIMVLVLPTHAFG